MYVNLELEKLEERSMTIIYVSVIHLFIHSYNTIRIHAQIALYYPLSSILTSTPL